MCLTSKRGPEAETFENSTFGYLGSKCALKLDISNTLHTNKYTLHHHHIHHQPPKMNVDCFDAYFKDL